MRTLFLAGVMFVAGCFGSSSGPKMAELSELPANIPVRTLWQASVGEAGDAVFFPGSIRRHKTVPLRASTPLLGRNRGESMPGRSFPPELVATARSSP
jgi:hypothetical protein